MDWQKILSITFTKNLSLNIEIGITFFVIAFVVLIIILVINMPRRRGLSTSEVKLNVNLGGIGTVSIKKNYEVTQIAHKAWTELATRKAGLPIDIEHDVISEVYDSWYALFERIRELVKNIPASQLQQDNTQVLVKLLVDSLNNGLRPHLTKWQARYRRWLKFELEKKINENKTPQEIQKMFPQYNELVSDLILINQQIVSYTNEIKKLLL